MLKNKTESAYQLLLSEKEIIVPEYIRRAIEWIKSNFAVAGAGKTTYIVNRLSRGKEV